ncbi:hypothetical protein HYW76_05725 [Candidatus Pacearchaeota archaeon]|nr:hypothetical protein [Candidatus Pacearchaeota archaeon]
MKNEVKRGMSYSKYIKRNGKTYGPYIYESKRIGNKVVSHYVGQGKSRNTGKNKKLFSIILFFGILVFSLLFFYYFSQHSISGRVTLQISESYIQGESVLGIMKLALKKGELIPADTQVKIELGEQEKTVLLSDVLKSESGNGNYYVESVQLTGNGEGYGFIGEKKVYPEISFSLRIKNSKEKEYKTSETNETSSNASFISEENITIPSELASPDKETAKESETGTVEQGESESKEQETSEEVTADSSPATSETPSVESSPVESTSEGGVSGMTGQSIKEMGNERKIEGVASKNKEFSYVLNEGESAEIIPGSVSVNGEKIGNSSINLVQNGNEIRVTTEYYKIEEGFGNEYISDSEQEFEINLSEIGISAESGELQISLVYNNITILTETKEVNIAGNISEEFNILSNITYNISEKKNDSLVMIKQISDINMKKNNEYKLNLSEYFENAKKYKIKDSENITFDINEEILVIIPSINWTGSTIAELEASYKNDKIEVSFSIIVSDRNFSVETIQHEAIVNKPVKWSKKVRLDSPEKVTLELPKESENVSIITSSENISIIDTNITRTDEINSTKLVIEENLTEYDIEYFTSSPRTSEEETSNGKKIVVSGSDEIHYRDITAFTTLPFEISEVNMIKLYWHVNNSRIQVNFTPFDLNNNSKFDYITWQVLSLSNQSYELYLNIINVYSHPTLKGNWSVEFNTSGSANLTITASRDLNYFEDYTRWSNNSEDSVLYDLRFFELKCGANILDYSWIGENCSENECSVFIENYSCNETGTEISKVLTSGKHVIKFNFGGIEAYAYNEVTPPGIIFVAPTPGNLTSTTNISVLINTSIVSSNLTNVSYNWNGTNYNYYDNSSLVLMMNFDNVSTLGENNTHAVDVSKYGNNGTITGAVWNVTGKYGEALTFDDGTDDYIQLATDGTGKFDSQNFSISMWVYTPPSWGAAGDYRPLFSYDFTSHDSPYYSRQLRFNTGAPDQQGWVLWGWNDGSSYQSINSVSASPTNQWVHIAAIYTSGRQEIWQNGILVASGTRTDTVTFYNQEVWIGKCNFATTKSMTLDEVRVYNRAISAGEVYQLYASNLQKFNSTQWYLTINQSYNATKRLDNATYTYQLTARDTSGNSNSTDLRTIIIGDSGDTTFPVPEFIATTPANATSTANTSFGVNVSILEANLANVTYTLNSTSYPYYDNSSLVLMMNFDNVSALGENNTHAVDVSKSGNNGTITGAVWNVTGKYGKALTFDGVDDNIDLGSGFANLLSGNFVISSFVYPVGLGSINTIVSRADYVSGPGGKGWHAYLSSSGKITFDVGVSGGGWLGYGWTSYQTSSNLTLNQWSHILIIREGTTGAGGTSKLEIYVNGINQSYTVSGGNDVGDATTKNIMVGKYGPTSYLDTTGFFNGTIDELRIWNRSLTGTEIYQQYAGNLQKFNSTQWHLSINQSLNATTNLSIGTYQYQVTAKDRAGNSNSTDLRTLTITSGDTSYPVFSDYWDNNASLFGNGLALFNVTIENTNGSVYLNINGSSVKAINVSANVYNTSIVLYNGTYLYNWTAYGNGSLNNINVSVNRYYVVNNTPVYSQVNISYPINASSFPRGNNSITYEDDMNVIENNITIIAKVYDNSSLAGLDKVNCSFYVDDSFIGKSATNSSGICNISYDKTDLKFGVNNISVNYTDVPTPYLYRINISNVSFNLDNWTMHVDISNFRNGGGASYYVSDVAGVYVNITRNNNPINVTNLTLIMTDNTDTEQKVFRLANFSIVNTGIYFTESLVPGINWIRWKAYASFNLSDTTTLVNVTSSQHTDVQVSATSSFINVSLFNLSNANISFYRKGTLGRYALSQLYLNSSNSTFAFSSVFGDNNYDAEIILTNNYYLTFSNFNVSQNYTLFNMQKVNHSGSFPNSVNMLSNIIASNYSGFGKSTLYFAKEFEPTKICSCQNWSLSLGNCSDNVWVCNSTSDYEYLSNASTFWINVSHFTGYAGGAGYTANLTIFDNNDTIGGNNAVFTGQQARFYSNYTNSTSGLVIIGANCNLTENSSGSWSAPVNMTYNSTSLLYEYNRTFSSALTVAWNASCLGNSSYSSLNATDTIIIASPASATLNISSCNSILNQTNAVYNLTANLPSNGTCLFVIADNITIDGKGFAITGNGSGFGINATNGTGPGFSVNVKNLIIVDFSSGIGAHGAVNNTGNAWNGGSVSVINSSIGGNISTFGGGSAALGVTSAGSGGDVNLTNSSAGIIKTYGGNVAGFGSTNGNGGDVIIQNSNVSDIWTYGGGDFAGLVGGHGGSITVTNSYLEVDVLYAHGGSAVAYSVYGDTSPGNGGNILITHSLINLTSTNLTLFAGTGNVSNGTNGLLTINYSSSFIDTNANYSKMRLTIINSSVGRIDFISGLNGTNINGRLSSNITIKNNSVYVDSPTLELNKSANITFYNLPTTFTSPVILRDGVVCNSSTSPACYNSTSLNAGNVVINVSSWSNYSIGDLGNPDVILPMTNLSSPFNNTGTTNTTMQFSCNATDNIQLSNITLTIYNSTKGINYTNTASVSGTTNRSAWNVTLSVQNYSWNCRAYDNSTNAGWQIANWSLNMLPSPVINLQVLTPANLSLIFNASQNRFFNVTAQVCCLYANCGEVNVSLDPTAPDVSWNTTFVGSISNDVAYEVKQTTDGGYIVVGYTVDNFDDFLLIRYTSGGIISWNNSYNKGGQEEGYGVDITSDGGYIISGRTATTMWIIKTNSTGGHLWNATFTSGDGASDSTARKIRQVNDGNYTLIGDYSPMGDTNISILKLNSTGGAIWNATYDMGPSDFAYSFIQSLDLNYTIAGTNGTEMWIIKTNSTGGHLWNVTYNFGGADEARGITQTSDGNYTIAGHNGTDIILLGLNSTGGHIWNASYISAGTDKAYSIANTSDGGCIVAGVAGSDMWVIRTNSIGGHVWNKTYNGGGSDEAYSIIQTSDGGYVVAGKNGTDLWLIKLASDTTSTKGLINTTIGATPFYTNQSNPRNVSLNAGDCTNITFWVNATGNVNANYTFFAYANLTSNMSIMNVSGNWNVTIISSAESIPPYFITIPANTSINYTQGFGVDFNANDETGFGTYAINSTTLFSINSSGWLANSTNDIAVGNYYINVTINDTSNNINSTIYWVNVSKANVSLSLSLIPGSANISQGIFSNGTSCPSQLTCNLSRNNSGIISNGLNATYSAGYYNFTYNTSGNVNYSSAIVSSILNISQTSGLAYIYINFSRANFTANNDSSSGKLNITLNATLQAGIGNIELWVNGSLYNNGSSPQLNITNLTIGFYNVSSIYRGNINYTSSTETFWINVSIAPYCGDSVCSADETCSTCSADCGSCSSPPGGGGGGGGCIDDCKLGNSTIDCSPNVTNSLRFKTCGNFDADSCLDWGNYTYIECSGDESCYSGKCISGNCTENWACSWTECLEEDKTFYSFAYDCSDLNSCGSEFNIPSKIECGNVNITNCTAQFNCSEWGECLTMYTLSDIINNIKPLLSQQERVCEDASLCENSKIEKQECQTYLPVSARTAEWCNESYTELYNTNTGILISRIKTNELDLNNAEIRFEIINFSGYCNYCYDSIQDFDEAGIDCGGNCQACSVSINRENLIFNNNNMDINSRYNYFILISKFALLFLLLACLFVLFLLRRKESDLEKVLRLIRKAEKLLINHKKEEVRKIYREIREIYQRLNSENKKRVIDRVMIIYHKMR